MNALSLFVAAIIVTFGLASKGVTGHLFQRTPVAIWLRETPEVSSENCYVPPPCMRLTTYNVWVVVAMNGAFDRFHIIECLGII